MLRPIALFAAVAALIIGFWAWLGSPVQMPPSPLAERERIPCVSYAPFRGTQSPLVGGTHIEARQIEDDIARLASVTSCVRTYSIEHGVDQVPAIAEKHGIKVIQGIWLSSNPAKNAWQIDTAIALAKKFPNTITSLVVGNEVLLRGEMSATDLAAAILRVKAAVTVPVTYADVWEFWLRHRDLASAADFITIHILPYWEDFPIPAENAGAHVRSIQDRVAKAFPGKEILIGETGWPSAGRMREGALPSPVDQARVLHDVVAAAKAGNFRINVIESFDQPWKRALEGTVGGYWGVEDDARSGMKFAWGAPVSNHPHWRLQAAGGIALAAIIFAAGWMAAGGGGGGRWVAVAGVAVAAGALIGLSIEKFAIESLGAGGWARSAGMAIAAILGPVVTAAALMRGTAIPSFARVLGGANARADGALQRVLGLALILTCVMAIEATLGLVFDPRYKDFPFSALGAPALAFLVLAFAVRAKRDGEGAAERLAAALFVLGAIYIAFNEGFANWQAQSVVAALLVLAVTLLRVAGVRRRG